MVLGHVIGCWSNEVHQIIDETLICLILDIFQLVDGTYASGKSSSSESLQTAANGSFGGLRRRTSCRRTAQSFPRLISYRSCFTFIKSTSYHSCHKI